MHYPLIFEWKGLCLQRSVLKVPAKSARAGYERGEHFGPDKGIKIRFIKMAIHLDVWAQRIVASDSKGLTANNREDRVDSKIWF